MGKYIVYHFVVPGLHPLQSVLAGAFDNKVFRPFGLAAESFSPGKRNCFLAGADFDCPKRNSEWKDRTTTIIRAAAGDPRVENYLHEAEEYVANNRREPPQPCFLSQNEHAKAVFTDAPGLPASILQELDQASVLPDYMALDMRGAFHVAVRDQMDEDWRFAVAETLWGDFIHVYLRFSRDSGPRTEIGVMAFSWIWIHGHPSLGGNVDTREADINLQRLANLGSAIRTGISAPIESIYYRVEGRLFYDEIERIGAAFQQFGAVPDF